MFSTRLCSGSGPLAPYPCAKNLWIPWYNMAKAAPGVPFHLSILVESAWPRKRCRNVYFFLPHARPVPVKSWSYTSWFGQWSPDLPSSAPAGLPVPDRRRVTWKPPVSQTAGSGLETRAERNKSATTIVGIKGRSRPTLQHARTCTLNSLLLAVGFGVGWHLLAPLQLPL